MSEPIAQDLPDLIVVGGGSAGCAIAARLAEAGRSVVLLEAGKSDDTLRLRIPALSYSVVSNPDYDWGYQGEADPSVDGRADKWPAGRRLGGGSAVNGMIYVRGHAWDYDHWAELGATGWSAAEVRPYFKRMETFEDGANAWRGDAGPIHVERNRMRYPIVDAYIDDKLSRIESRDTGWFIAHRQDLEQQARQKALSNLVSAAKAQGIDREAEVQAKTLIGHFFTALGYEKVEYF